MAIRAGFLGLSILILLAGAPARAQVCGDNETQGDETCDDGNTVGGDGCAANCTDEHPVTVTIRPGSNFNAQGRLGQAYGSPGLPLTGTLTLTVGAQRASDASGRVPFVIRAADARIDPVALAGTACFCARPTVPGSFPDGIVAQGNIGCGESGLTGVDYGLSQDHNIRDVDPDCMTGIPQPDGHCTGPLQRVFTGDGPSGAATAEIGFSFYELGDCDATPSDPDQRGCTSDDPVPVPVQTLLLTTGVAVGRIINADDTDFNLEPGVVCGSAPCAPNRNGAPFNCDALLADPAINVSGALAGVDVAIHLSTLDDVVDVIELQLSNENTPTPTPSATHTPLPTNTEVPTHTAAATHTATPTQPLAATATGTPESTVTPVTAMCVGDCDGNGTVEIAELIRGVGIALGTQQIAVCRAFDRDGDGEVSISELIQAVNVALSECP
jgi:cysteine-rich repeat protein